MSRIGTVIGERIAVDWARRVVRGRDVLRVCSGVPDRHFGVMPH